MKTGQNINEIAKQVLKMAAAKKDYAMDTRNLKMTRTAQLAFVVGGKSVEVAPTDRCVNQIAARVGIPRAYAARLQTEAPGLLADNVNHWFQSAPEVRMLRTYQNGENVGRAFLSQKYRSLDNDDMLRMVLPKLMEAGCEIKSSEVTEKRLYVQAVFPKVQGEIKVGDVVQAGVTISNSEVGAGSLRVEPLLYRLRCTNGMILPSALKKHHIGRAGEGEWEAGEANEVFSDATRQLDDKAFWAKVNDVVKSSLNEVKFKENMARMLEATKVDTGKPTEAVEVLVKRYGFSDDESDSVLEHLSRGGDLSLWGLANAVTRTAEDLASYDRAVEFERIGGEVIELAPNMFN